MGKLGWVLVAAVAALATAMLLWPTFAHWAAQSERQAPWWCYYEEGKAISGTIPRDPPRPFDLCWRAENRNPGQIRTKLEDVLWARVRLTGVHRMFFDGRGGEGDRLYFHLNRKWQKGQWGDPANPRMWTYAQYPIAGGWAGIALNARNPAEQIIVKIYRAGWTTVPFTNTGETGETNLRRPVAAYTWEVVVTNPTGCTRPATSPALSSTVATSASAAKIAIEAVLEDVRSCFP